MRVLVTGGAGFIGSNSVGALLQDDRFDFVRVVDNLSTGDLENIREYIDRPDFEFIEGDIRDYEFCLRICKGVDVISHQAALGSVPRSITDPVQTNEVNITGTLNVFHAAVSCDVQRVVFAASSSTYGDEDSIPKSEGKIGKPLSPYAVTKYVNELYADVFSSIYDFEYIGLRYFNIFGPKQSPDGPYAAVIPSFFKAALSQVPPMINGDGNITRDFTYVENAVQANILSLLTSNLNAVNEIYNIACGEQTSLNDLWAAMCNVCRCNISPIYGPDRMGDIQHSLADISKAQKLLGFEVETRIEDGLEKSLDWFKQLKFKQN